ncbi:MAG TPA: chondroitinase family polysaccharide lyase [Paludibacteraceae bacterium]|nr:chondroitinase family polysaccharide lyase [Paludibacteraceae bacterium]
MKRNVIFILFITLTTFVSGQNYSFEEPETPTDWIASGGDVLSVTTEHFKDGNQSLCWITNGNNSLRVNFVSFLTNTSNGTRLQLYSPEVTNDTLIIEYYSALNLLRRKAFYLINYKGWRDFSRKYTEFSTSNSSQDIVSVKFTLKRTDTKVRKIYFDKVDFNTTVAVDRVVGNQWVLDKNYFSGNTEPVTINNFDKDIPVQAASSQEIADLNLLRNKLVRVPASPTLTVLVQARSYVDGLNIQRNTDGSVKGKVINNFPEYLTIDSITNIAVRLEVLASDYLKNPTNSTITTRFSNYLDHILDQGIAEGCSFAIASSNYTPSRDIPARLLNAINACTPEQKVELLKLVRWFTFYGNMYYPESIYKTSLVSDIIYLYLPHIMASAIFYPDDNTAVRELKAFRRFIERNTEYIPGGNDILKPDGTGFHHNTHYNNYMYCYQTWVEYMNYLKGTQYRISPEAYNRIKKAVVSVYRMATNDVNENHFFANSLAGRNPFVSGQKLYFNKTLFQNLISIGGDCMGTAMDEELAGKYNYFYKTNFYNVPTSNQEGFYQFNYSPIGIYRKNNWVVTMRSPTTKFWGAEIYSNANRFGRYQSHGTLEVLYDGSSLAYSGEPTNNTGGGWDWNMPQGATVVQYNTWQDLMPNRNLTDRFDQYTKTKDFAGALSWGDCGMFAADFDQIDSWGSQRFTPTNLTFKKSMFAFDGMVISLGSNISSSGTYNSAWFTSTNLFQNIVTGVNGNFVVNGNNVTKPYNTTLSSTTDNWFVTPTGTGYFIPKGNDDIVVKYDAQSTPKEDGSDYASPVTTLNAAKAYLNHGVKPTSKNYSFVVVPGTNTTAMQAMTAQLQNNGGSIYKINSQTSTLHSIIYLPAQINAYAFFDAVSNISFGKIKSCSSSLLILQKENIVDNKLSFAVCNPNLKPVTDPIFGWVSSPSSITITLAGNWREETAIEGVTFYPPVNDETVVSFNLKDGEPVYFSAVNYYTKVEDNKVNNWFIYQKNNDNLIIRFNELDSSDRRISVYSIDGKLLKSQISDGNSQQVIINTGDIAKGVNICTVSNIEVSKTFKWIN